MDGDRGGPPPEEGVLPLAHDCAVVKLDRRQREIRIGSRWWGDVCAANAYPMNDAAGGRCWTQSKNQSSDERNNSEKDEASHKLPPSQGKPLAPGNPLGYVRPDEGSRGRLLRPVRVRHDYEDQAAVLVVVEETGPEGVNQQPDERFIGPWGRFGVVLRAAARWAEGG